MISEYVAALFTSAAYLIQSRDRRVAILCYRGTPPTSAITWLTDFEVEPVTIEIPGPKGAPERRVHGGFYRNVRSTRSRSLSSCSRHSTRRRCSGRRTTSRTAPRTSPGQGLEALYVAGHSLGGASAALLAASLVFEPIMHSAVAPDTGPKILDRLRAVYTYGSPMVGNPAFADACASSQIGPKLMRYVYANDVVPQVPPKAAGSYKHFGPEFRYLPPGERGEWHPSARPRQQLRSLSELATAPLAIVAKSIKLTRHIPFHASLATTSRSTYYLDALTPEELRSEFGD